MTAVNSAGEVARVPGWEAFKKRYRQMGLLFLLIALVVPSVLVSCSDEPDTENYYTFTGEMMSDYLRKRDQFSQFAQIIDRAGMMNLLSTYGAYTCFAPDNDAVTAFLKGRGKSSVDDLSDADCDTIARTHLVTKMYTTFDMQNGVLASPNMNRRYLEVSHELDKDSNAVVFVNRQAHIYFALQDDSVENGIVQPIDRVLESSTRMLPDIIGQNDRVSIYNAALSATGLRDSMFRYKDENYDSSKFPIHSYTSDVNKERATVPDDKLYGYTAFLVPDSVLMEKYGIPDPKNGIEASLKALYQLACTLYDPVYPDDVNSASHDYGNLTDRSNPLNRFMAYHVLDRNAKGVNFLTPKYDVGIVTAEMNPVDWYTTLLPYTMMKFERLTVRKWVGDDVYGERYINRRHDDIYQIRGSKITPTVETAYVNDAINGCYFYIDDVVAFDKTMRDDVMNCRIRMDFGTIFPELMTNDIRLNGTQSDMKKQDPVDDTNYNKYGRNYYFPEGYLEGVTLKGSAYFIYRRPHDYYWSYEGDEMNLQGTYDFSFRIPPVPVEGDYQIRLGYAATATRGIAQIYFDDKPQGIPLDMRKNLGDPSILGSTFSRKAYTDMTEAEKQEDRKTLKNLGYYRGARGGYHYNGAGATTTTRFCNNKETFRIVLCTVHILPGEDHFLRIRSVSSKMGNDNEFMLDYLEIVPKSVYGVTDEGAQEDDL